MASENIADPMSDNEALREILGETRVLEDAIRQRYTSTETEEGQAVADGAPYERAANPNAVKTVITNTHATNPVKVYEEGGLVKILTPGETWASPLNGAGALAVTAEAAAPGEIAVTTYLKA